MRITLRESKSPDEFALYYDLRWRVLRKAWTQDRESSKDDHEKNAVHLMAWAEEGLVGVGRLHFNSPNEAQVRYMAVEPAFARRGVGAALLQGLEERAKQLGATSIILNAREGALGFYQKHGYNLGGQTNTLFESIVHWRMQKSLSPAGREPAAPR